MSQQHTQVRYSPRARAGSALERLNAAVYVDRDAETAAHQMAILIGIQPYLDNDDWECIRSQANRIWARWMSRKREDHIRMNRGDTIEYGQSEWTILVGEK